MALVFGCEPDPASTLVVSLRTDYVPVVQFSSVEVSLFFGDGARVDQLHRIRSRSDYFESRTVAVFDAVPHGDVRVRVRLVGERSAVLAEQIVLHSHRSDSAVFTAVDFACRNVECGERNDGQTSCVGGACQDPRCTPSTPEHCTALCSNDAECESSGCRDGSCADGVCLVTTRPGACSTGQVCLPSGECIEDPLRPMDAGTDAPRDVGVDTCEPELCTDGIDNDCDGVADCADSDCEGVSCDDGVFCNGAEACSGGACVQSPRCPQLCDESAQRCVECLADTDCSAPEPGAWSSCTWETFCSEVGSRSRQVYRPVCEAGMCAVVASSEEESCRRSSQQGNLCRGTAQPWWVCCGGACTNTAGDNGNCGACGVDCSHTSGSCQQGNTGGWQCGCTYNMPCQQAMWTDENGLSSGERITCYNGDCQCQCPGGQICEDGGCGLGFECVDAPGDNYCRSNDL